MRNCPVVALAVACGLLGGCEPAPQKNGVEICAQAIDLIQRNDGKLQEPRDWNRLMTAAARFVYIDNDCGSLVTESKENLCGSLGDAIYTFANNPSVPAGPNRDNALSVGNQTFREFCCAETFATQ